MTPAYDLVKSPFELLEALGEPSAAAGAAASGVVQVRACSCYRWLMLQPTLLPSLQHL